jgi:alkanesulfonate monooxygenase SsuD/methylene tetrahydromethanopterin reductase-like flavin-dependent oxidoreductase (luciferase family)
MREVVEIVRLVNAKAHTGELTKYEGRYHKHDWSELQAPAAPLRTDIPIWIAALRGPLISLAAEIADGVIGHPIWSVEWCTTKIPDYLKRGLDRAGKKRGDVEFNAWLFVAVSDDKKQAIEDAKATVAFYAGVEQYEEFFAAHGFAKEAALLQAGVQRGVRKRIEPMYEVVDSLTLVPPAYNLGADRLMGYAGAIASTFYS